MSLHGETWRPRAVLFDFDGTLIDSYPAITATVNHLRSKYDLPPLTVDVVRGYVGYGPANLFAKTVPGGKLDEDLADFRVHHATVFLQLTNLLPGAETTLHGLHQAGLRLGVCSNKPVIFTKRLVKHLGLAPLFQFVLGPEDVPRGKPAPDMLLEAVRRLGIQPSESLYVGDMGLDIESARAAQMPVWVIPTGSSSRSQLEAAAPDRIIDELTELLELVN